MHMSTEGTLPHGGGKPTREFKPKHETMEKHANEASSGNACMILKGNLDSSTMTTAVECCWPAMSCDLDP